MSDTAQPTNGSGPSNRPSDDGATEAAATSDPSDPTSGSGVDPLRLGGMAFRNGLLIHGPTHWALAARAEDGSIEVGSGPKPSFTPGRAGETPLLRGPLKLAEAFAVVPLARWKVRSSRLPFENLRVVGGALASMSLANLIQRDGKGGIARESAASVLGLLPATIALQDRTLASYHGVEHKAIGAYEKGSLDPRTAPKEHERCGSNLIAPMMILSVAGQLIVDRLFAKPGQVHRAAAGLTSTSLAVELFAHAERNPESPAALGMRRVGYEIQRILSTAEPSEEQIEVGQAALAEILRVEEAEVPSSDTSPDADAADSPPPLI